MKNRKNLKKIHEKANKNKWGETELEVYGDEELLAEDWFNEKDSRWNDLLFLTLFFQNFNKSLSPLCFMNKKGENRKFSPCIFSPKNRKGQFYLIAAIIIVTIAAGFVTISNSASSHQTPDINYLRDEIKIESSKAIDYATLNNKDFTDIMINVSEQYINNTVGNNFYFIFGTTTTMTFLAYQSFYANITLDNIDKTDIVGTGKIYSQTFAPSGGTTNVTINGNDYVFKLNMGNNYGFVVSSAKGGQVYTAVG